MVFVLLCYCHCLLNADFLLIKCLLRLVVLQVSCCSKVLSVSFSTDHFVMVPQNMTYLHCYQHFVFEHLFKLYLHNVYE